MGTDTATSIDEIKKYFYIKDGVLMRGDKKAGAWFDKSSGYWKVKFKGKAWLLHRLIFFIVNGYLPPMVDHKDRDVNNNDPSNLRAANRGENTINSEARSDNTSGYKGVTWHKNVGKWHSSVFKNGKRYYCGVYDCKHEAAKAYNEKAKELFGEFAVLNNVKDD